MAQYLKIERMAVNVWEVWSVNPATHERLHRVHAGAYIACKRFISQQKDLYCNTHEVK